MISVNDLSVRFGGFTLFDSISFMVNPRDRIGLTGKNGAGKSTLLKIFAGEQAPSQGQVVVPQDVRVGYLPQDMEHANDKTVYEEAKLAFDLVLKMEAEIDNINHQLETRDDYESKAYMDLIERLTHLSERLDLLDAAHMDAEIEKTLLGLGFEREDLARPTSEFSGGWRMRVELAKILLQKPDVFLLDEPTNHLDIESIQWLESFLSDYPGAVVLISHDRIFLDTITNRTIEISMGRIHDYKASYSKYLELRKERRGTLQAAYENQQKMIDDTERFIERFRYKASKAAQVQSRVKMLDKIERVELDDEDKATLAFRFPPAPRAGTVVVEAKDLRKAYGDHLVFEHVDLVIERGEKVAFVGRNGEGKSTLSKIILGQLEHQGKMKLGHNVRIGYFAQSQAQELDVNKTVFETLDDVAAGDIRKRVRDILGSFLFSGEEVDKKVGVLSGGERGRLALAKLLLEPYSMLLLDEPTNHLDMRSKDVLQKALNHYDGTLVVVSHDRHFLDGLTTKIYEFRDRRVKEHLGDINYFLEKRKLENMRQLEIRQKEDKKANAANKEAQGKQGYQQRKELDKQIRKLESDMEQAEQRVNALEEAIRRHVEAMADPGAKVEDDGRFADYSQNKKELERWMAQWEETGLRLDELKAQRDALL